VLEVDSDWVAKVKEKLAVRIDILLLILPVFANLVAMCNQGCKNVAKDQ
jgi:hypothetical protein